MEHVARDDILQAADFVRAHTTYKPTVGLVLGSGLSLLAQRVSQPDQLLYQDIPHFPHSTVVGHTGRLILGELGGVTVCLMQGRVHYYEGYSLAQVTFPIRVMQALGVNTLIVTNAAGGIRQDLQAGDLMAINDHLNLPGLSGNNPLRGANDDDLGERFPDMSRAYDPQLLQMLHAEAEQHGIPLKEGVYAMVGGPSFETPAEIRFLRLIGADAVGMSTVPEVIVARHAGMRVLGISLISNPTIDSINAEQSQTLHEAVLETAQRAVPVLTILIEGLLQRLGRSQ
jgi:purine-nucleoside phosphorylase